MGIKDIEGYPLRMSSEPAASPFPLWAMLTPNTITNTATTPVTVALTPIILSLLATDHYCGCRAQSGSL